MPPLPAITPADVGILFPPIIDGYVFSAIPAGMSVTPTPIGDHVDTLDGGSRFFQPRPVFDGISDRIQRYTIEVPYNAIRPEDKEALDELEVSAGVRLVTPWIYVVARYTCKGGVRLLYLPRYRANAAQIYAGFLLPGLGVVSTDFFPVIARRNGTPLVVSYSDGPALADPGAGNLVISKNAAATGPARGYVPFYLGDATALGDVITIKWVAAFQCEIVNPRRTMPQGQARESRVWTLLER